MVFPPLLLHVAEDLQKHGCCWFCLCQGNKVLQYCIQKVKFRQVFKDIVKMRAGERTGRFKIDLHTAGGVQWGEAEQAELGGHHAARPGPHAMTTKNPVPSRPGATVPRHSS